MNYFRVNETDASGLGMDFWEYFKGDYDIDEAKALFEENNSWVHSLDCRRNKSQELTEEQYKTGTQFNRLYEDKHEVDAFRRFYNLYPTPAMAQMFAKRDHKSGYVRIGFPNIHNVYKVNQDGNFIFVYHYDAESLGKLPSPPAYF